MERNTKRNKESEPVSSADEVASNDEATTPIVASEPVVKPAGRDAFQEERQDHSVKSEPGKPRVIGGICEFCGIVAQECTHYGKAE